MPGSALLPPHQGIILTRGLQEWACLLPQDLSFAPVARLLGWQTHEAQLLSDTTMRVLVRTHGQLIRPAEQAEVQALLTRDDLATAIGVTMKSSRSLLLDPRLIRANHYSVMDTGLHGLRSAEAAVPKMGLEQEVMGVLKPR